MPELKKLTSAGITSALEKAERYRLLNEPAEAESICLDVLAVDPNNQKALITLLLAQTDAFGSARSKSDEELQGVLARMNGEYERAYYAGIILERRAKAKLEGNAPHSKDMAYDLISRALEQFQKAEAIRPPGNDDALLRWNTCVRMIQEHRLSAPREDKAERSEEGLGLE